MIYNIRLYRILDIHTPQSRIPANMAGIQNMAVIGDIQYTKQSKTCFKRTFCIPEHRIPYMFCLPESHISAKISDIQAITQSLRKVFSKIWNVLTSKTKILAGIRDSGKQNMSSIQDSGICYFRYMKRTISCFVCIWPVYDLFSMKIKLLAIYHGSPVYGVLM